MSDEPEESGGPGVPAWVMTFADLMSLLMCFFVLLLSFSEMDVQKYKQIAGSMKLAFGVQREKDVKKIPMGTSVIAQEFSPAVGEPTPINEVKQQTSDEEKRNLKTCDVGDGKENSEAVLEKQKQKALAEAEAKEIKKVEENARDVASKLNDHIAKGEVEVETQGKKIVIRIKEQGSFDSGSDEVKKTFVPVINKIRAVLKKTPGKVNIEGHTDDIPIETERFRSNWDLSSARAASVAHALFGNKELDQGRFAIAGHADSKPLVENNSKKNRAKNRRVEIVIQQGDDISGNILETISQGAKDSMEVEQ